MKYLVIFLIVITGVFCEECSIKNFNITWQTTNLGMMRHARVLDSNLYTAGIVAIKPNQNVTRICEETFSAAPNINFLFLNSSGIREIQAGSFAKTKASSVIDLSRNDLEMINDGIFSGLNIRILKLRFNKIKQIVPNAFNNMVNLRILDLSFNEIEDIPLGLFKNSTNMNQIYLGNNRIKSLQNNIFLNLKANHATSKTLSIYLGSNEISFIDELAFNGLTGLNTLDLSGNKIVILNSKIFSSINHIKVLLLKNNGMECISNGLDFLNKISKIHFDSHSWNCVCLEELESWYEESDLDATYIDRFDCK